MVVRAKRKTAKSKKPRCFAELIPRDKLFVEGYLKYWTKKGAAICAGYKAPETSGPAKYRKPYIRRAIDEKMQEKLDVISIDSTWLLNRLVMEATADMADLYADDGSIKPVSEWPEIWRQGVIRGLTTCKDFDTNKYRVKSIKLESRSKLLELIGKHIDVQAFSENTNVVVPGLAEVLEQLSGKSRGLPPAAQAALPASEPKNILRKHDPEVAIPELETAAPKLAMWTPDPEKEMSRNTIHDDPK